MADETVPTNEPATDEGIPVDQPAAAKTGRSGAIIAVVVVIVLILGGGAFLMTRGGQTASGSVTVPEDCPSADELQDGPIAFSLKTSEGEDAGSGPGTFVPGDGSCAMTFSFPVEAKADTYTFFMDITPPEATTAVSAAGPTLTSEQLAQPIDLGPDDFPVITEAASSADDKAAQSSLRNAIVAAKIHFTDNDSYAGFDPEVAASIEPSLSYDTSATATESMISIRDVSDTTMLLATKSSAGTVFCIADDTIDLTYGVVDAQTVAECADPSW